MKKWLIILCTLLSFAVSAKDEPPRKDIKVGGYIWPPFVELKGRSYEGLTLDLIDAANATQGDFLFEFVLTTPQDRFKDFHNDKFDMIFLEDINWGWNAYPVKDSQPLAEGTEVYIALDSRGRSQKFFQELPEKTISVIKGFHYSFADSNNDEEYLKKHFKITLRDTAEQVLQDVLDGKSEIGVVSDLYLQYAFAQDRKIKPQLLIANKFDQDFELAILVGKDSAMTVEQVNLMIARLKSEGVMKKLWEKYQMDPGVKED